MGNGDFSIIVNITDFSINLSSSFATAVENPIRLPQSFNGLVDVYFANPSGNPAAPWNYVDPVAYASPEISIAQTNSQLPPYLAQALTPSYVSGSTAYLEFAFDLDTGQMAAALGSSPSLKAVFEVDWIPAGVRQLTAQCPIIVSRAIIVSANPPPVPAANYYTQIQINAIIAALTAVGTAIAISASGSQTDTLTVGNKVRTTPVNVTAFTGTANIDVSATNAVVGAVQTYIIAWPASSTGATVNIIDAASTATLASVPGTSTVSSSLIQLYFNGINWTLLNWS